jgi:hypothetical protein
MRSDWSIRALLLFTLAIRATSDVAGDGLVICLLMMARNEEVLIRRHLTSWSPLLDGGCIVVNKEKSLSLSNPPTFFQNLLYFKLLTCSHVYIKGQVDDRSTDGSHTAFLDPAVLPLSSVSYDRRHVYHYTFDGLGPARSLLLSEADAKFGHVATHYFIADPDWRFDLSPQQSVRDVIHLSVNVWVYISFLFYYILYFI